jgi:type I restriction enzyme S subunit
MNENCQAFVDEFTPSILAKAFRGDLTPQDPNDAPAEKLLERLGKKAE